MMNATVLRSPAVVWLGGRDSELTCVCSRTGVSIGGYMQCIMHCLCRRIIALRLLCEAPSFGEGRGGGDQWEVGYPVLGTTRAGARGRDRGRPN